MKYWGRLIQHAIRVIVIANTLLLTATIQANCQSQPPEKTLENLFNKAVQQKNSKDAGRYALQLADGYAASKNFEKSIHYYSQCLKYVKGKDFATQYVANRGTGNVYNILKNFSKSAEFFQASIEAATLAKNKTFEAEGLYLLADAEAKAGRFKKAIAPLESALLLAGSLANEKMQADCYSKLAECHQKLGNTEKSKAYTNLYNQLITNHKRYAVTKQQVNELKQQVARVETEKNITELLLSDQNEKLQRTKDSLELAEAKNRKRQMEIDLLNKDKELSSLKISEQNAMLENEKLWRNSIIGGVLLAGVLVALVLYSYKKKIAANKKIEDQNKAIKSSINYAKRIQEAMLPDVDIQQKFASDSFVLFKPRDTVSGDFYWFNEIKNGHANNTFAFAAVDCTGHGVPGAFMSMIGMKALNGITGRGIKETNEILSAMHSEIRSALRQEETGNNDGMDIALCVFRKEEKLLEFSGAKNPLIYIQDNELFQIKGDIHPIGGSKSKADITYKKHSISVDKPTMVYLFSDGYRDQFGGKDNTKFMSKNFTRLLLDIHQKPMNKQKEILDLTIEEWKGNYHQTDDILIMGLKL